MKCIAALLALFALFTASAAARADTIFDVQGSFLNGTSLGGTLSYNGTTSTFDAANVTLSLGNSVVDLANLTVSKIRSVFDLQLGSVRNLDLLNILIPAGDLRGSASGSVCSVAAPCRFLVSNLNTFDPLMHGSIAPAVTPEPSSIMLMGTGLVGMAACMRRRMRRV